jgi:4a-hydroxytetrahydrobiopterin dehydratase
MHDILTDEQIAAALKELNVAWSAIPGQGLVRVFATKNFAEGVALVVRVADIADRINHHPDVHLLYDEVEITLITHETGSVTTHDFELAKAIDQAIA